MVLARVVALLLPSLGVARAEEARPCPERMTHLAVLIGVGAYPDVSTVAATAGVPEARNASWKPLNASRDLDALGAALRRYGFRSGSPTHSTWRLLDEAATAGGIRGVLSELSACTSRRGAAAGGALRDVYVHYSGHGQQIPDDDGDEPDGWDESWVAWGAPMDPAEGYDFAQHVRDDDLRDALTAVRHHLGASGTLAMTSDSCHSGTISRGSAETTDDVARYAEPIGAPAAVYARASRQAQEEDLPAGPSGDGRAAAVVIGAAESSQPAWETWPEVMGLRQDGRMGRFTAALVEALTDPRAPATTWQGLFERVSARVVRMSPRQQPVLEGDGTIGLFGASGSVAEPYAVVAAVDAAARVVELDGGFLSGFAEGASVALHRAGADGPEDGRSRIAVGTVVRAEPTRAWVEVPSDAQLGAVAVGADRVFVTEGSYGSLALSVTFEAGAESAQPRVLRGIRITADGIPDVTVRASARGFSMQRRGDAQPFAIDVAPATVEALLTGALRSRLLDVVLASTGDGDADGLRMSAVPRDAYGRALSAVPPRFAALATGGALALLPGDRRFDLVIENPTPRAMYASLIVRDPDGQVAQLWPSDGFAHEPIAPGGSMPLPVQGDGSHVVGRGSLVLIASPAPNPLGSLFAVSGSRGPAQDALDALTGLSGEAVTTRGLQAATSGLSFDAHIYELFRLSAE